VRHARTDPEQIQHDLSGVVGVLGDRDERTRAGQYRARADQ
jgi:hypothetical protein